MVQTRREFLAAAGGVSLGFMGIARLLERTASGAVMMPASTPYGPLVPDPAGVLDLPKGFEYRIISRIGEEMADGLRVPGKADGMAAFPGPGGKTLVICNHEVSDGDITNGPFGADMSMIEKARGRMYDPGTNGIPSLGGTSTIVFDTKTQTLEKQYMSIAGTTRNCAGGPTPWNSWLTCEENVTRKGEQGRAKDHGWVFEVPATDEVGLADPTPIAGMGRFNHEAIAIDPRSGIVYLTEDRGDGLLYRFIPNVRGKMHEGGVLQALVIKGSPSADTRNWRGTSIGVGDSMEVEWIDMEHIDAPEDDLRRRGFDAGAAKFARGEGICWGQDGVYIVCTNGGRARKGQVWKLEPSVDDATEEPTGNDRLSLFVEPNDGDVVDMPDNVGVAPSGDLYLCEDGSGEQFVVGVSPEGELFKFARNAKNNSEFAGVCFSPDGTTMFVNIQHAGLTLAITGPWRSA